MCTMKEQDKMLCMHFCLWCPSYMYSSSMGTMLMQVRTQIIIHVQPDSYYSHKKTSTRKKVTSRKRRRDQNDQIDELSSLVPLATPLLPTDTSLVPARYCSTSMSSTGIDKISVLRLTTSFLKLKGFMKESESIMN